MRDRVQVLVREAVNDLNDELEYDGLRDPTEETVIFDGSAGVDSLSLVSLIVSLEAACEAEFGVEVSLADERAMSRHRSPFRTVGSLIELILERLEANA